MIFLMIGIKTRLNKPLHKNCNNKLLLCPINTPFPLKSSLSCLHVLLYPCRIWVVRACPDRALARSLSNCQFLSK
nr:hypothetical protein [Tetragenococcus halophilus]